MSNNIGEAWSLSTGDKRVPCWEDVEELLDFTEPDTTVVITEEAGSDAYRVRWCPGTDLKPLGGVRGDEDAQIHYLHPEAGWLEIRAFSKYQ